MCLNRYKKTNVIQQRNRRSVVFCQDCAVGVVTKDELRHVGQTLKKRGNSKLKRVVDAAKPIKKNNFKKGKTITQNKTSYFQDTQQLLERRKP